MTYTIKIRRTGIIFAVLLATILSTGCGDSNDSTADQTEAVKEAATEISSDVNSEVTTMLTAAEEAMVTRIAAVATALEKTPAAAGAILAKYGLTAEEYEDEIYKIASSPALSAAFEKAKGH